MDSFSFSRKSNNNTNFPHKIPSQIRLVEMERAAARCAIFRLLALVCTATGVAVLSSTACVFTCWVTIAGSGLAESVVALDSSDTAVSPAASDLHASHSCLSFPLRMHNRGGVELARNQSPL